MTRVIEPDSRGAGTRQRIVDDASRLIAARHLLRMAGEGPAR